MADNPDRLLSHSGTDQMLSGTDRLAAAFSTDSFNERQRNTMTLGAAGFSVLVLLSFFSSDDGPVLCPFRRCTGGYCPGCGLTRSGGRLLRGDLAGSWAQHPWMVLGAAQAAVFAALYMAGTAAIRTRLRGWWRPLAFANSAALVGIWIFRLFDGSIPVPFSG